MRYYCYLEYFAIFARILITMNMRQTSIIHVHLLNKQKDYYCSSISAIFTVLTEDEIGFTENYLHHANLGAVIGKKAIIKRCKVISCPRGNNS